MLFNVIRQPSSSVGCFSVRTPQNPLIRSYVIYSFGLRRQSIVNSMLVVYVHLALLRQLWGERMLEKGCESCCDADIQDWTEEQTREENARLVLTAETEGQTSC